MYDKRYIEDFKELKLLLKAKGKCTTDHISMAGPWLQYRGHLENISQNLLMGATNAFNKTVNLVKNQISKIARNKNRSVSYYDSLINKYNFLVWNRIILLFT